MTKKELIEENKRLRQRFVELQDHVKQEFGRLFKQQEQLKKISEKVEMIIKEQEEDKKSSDWWKQ